jgi:hypothetical protein
MFDRVPLAEPSALPLAREARHRPDCAPRPLARARAIHLPISFAGGYARQTVEGLERLRLRQTWAGGI